MRLPGVVMLAVAMLGTAPAHAQMKAADLLAHCEANPGGDGLCRGFVEAALDGFILYPEERELDHLCMFKEPKASTDRLVEIAKAGLLQADPAARVSLNAIVVLRNYFRDPRNCVPQ